MDMPGMGSKTFHNHCQALYDLTPKLKTQHLKMAAQVVRQEHKKLGLLDPNTPDDAIVDIAVSMDGSWLKRGHRSSIGLVCAIDLETNICLDYHVCSKYCHKCEVTGKKKAAQGPQEFQLWQLAHQDECQKNFDPLEGSGMMEVQGSRILCERSVALHKFRYTKILSDGDSKAYAEINRTQPYGPDTSIEKEECINHVSKRFGTALRNLVTDSSKQGVRLGGKGRHLLLKNIS